MALASVFCKIAFLAVSKEIPLAIPNVLSIFGFIKTGIAPLNIKPLITDL